MTSPSIKRAILDFFVATEKEVWDALRDHLLRQQVTVMQEGFGSLVLRHPGRTEITLALLTDEGMKLTLIIEKPGIAPVRRTLPLDSTPNLIAMAIVAAL